MSYSNGPRIVTNGLVLYLDAGNSKSYPGSGTVWNDLSGNGNNGTLVNGPTYSGANKGSIVFDGANDYISGGSNTVSINNAITISAWIRHSAITGGQKRYLTVGQEIAVIRQNNAGQLHFYCTINSIIRSTLVSDVLFANTWYYIAGVWDGTSSLLYLNNRVLATNVYAGTLNGGNLNWAISADLNIRSENMNGNISQVYIYNRA